MPPKSVSLRNCGFQADQSHAFGGANASLPERSTRDGKATWLYYGFFNLDEDAIRRQRNLHDRCRHFFIAGYLGGFGNTGAFRGGREGQNKKRAISPVYSAHLMQRDAVIGF